MSPKSRTLQDHFHCYDCSRRKATRPGSLDRCALLLSNVRRGETAIGCASGRGLPTPRSRAGSKTGSFFRRVVIQVRLAVHREQHRAARRPVVVQRTRLAPDIISGRRHPVVILDAALQDERLLDLGVLVKGDVSAGFQP